MDRFGKILKKITRTRESDITTGASSTQEGETGASSTQEGETGGPARRKSLELASDKTRESWGLKKVAREAGGPIPKRPLDITESDLDTIESDREGASNTEKEKEVAEGPSQTEQTRVEAELLKDAQILTDETKILR